MMFPGGLVQMGWFLFGWFQLWLKTSLLLINTIKIQIILLSNFISKYFWNWNLHSNTIKENIPKQFLLYTITKMRNKLSSALIGYKFRVKANLDLNQGHTYFKHGPCMVPKIRYAMDITCEPNLLSLAHIRALASLSKARSNQ